MKQLKENTFWINYLRSAITVLVVFHHSNLAYTTFAYFDKEVYINSTHPVVDNHRWVGLDVLVNFNDIYFMSLMFLIGGLFLKKSIIHKGQKRFVLDRFKRLFIPFLLLGTFFMLIAYFPSYFLSKGNWNLNEYVFDFFTTQNWPVGPPWFIWLLFVFNLLFVVTLRPFSRFYSKLGQKINEWSINPLKIILLYIAITIVLYIPISYNIGANKWVGFGPFDFQLNRIFLYAGYFWIGVIIGSINFNNLFLSSQSKIVIFWKYWWLIAISIFIVLTVIPQYLTNLVMQHGIHEFYTWMIYYFLYVFSMCFSSLAMFTCFKALVKSEHLIWNSLSENAYMIYLCHYPFIIWTQFFLLDFEIHATTKTFITFVISLTLSWVLSIQLRKVKLIRKFL